MDNAGVNTETQILEEPVVPAVDPIAVLNAEIDCVLLNGKEVANQALMRVMWIQEHRNDFIAMGMVPAGYSNFIDLDNLTREQVVKALQIFPGKYTKTKQDSGMHYERDLGNGLTLRFYNAALPPGCKLVEKTVEIPAQPATTRKVFEIQCGGGDE